MIIIPNLIKDFLELYTYTYKSTEFEILRDFLKEFRIESNEESISNDIFSRTGRIFYIRNYNNIEKFEFVLGVKFFVIGPKTVTRIEEDYKEGEQYKCIRISHVAWEKGCRNVYAISDAAAFIKCNLIANELNWFAAESEKGRCRPLSFFERVMHKVKV